jgi:predicted GH43/DUF377 family glycosyl hydrolase/photosystem II stability/assembly factor-like uncharacterized protein
MKSFFFKLSLLIVVLVMSNGSLLAQYEWVKYHSNPLNIHGSPGSWNESVITPCVIFNSDLNRYEMWFTTFWNFPNAGIGFAYSSDGITWTLNSTNPVMTPGPTGWDSLFVGAVCVLKEGGTYKMWYTGWKSTTRYPHSIGYATSPNGINWTKHPDPVLSPSTGWESGAVGYPSVIKVGSSYVMFYTGEVSAGIALTGRAISTDGITWQRYANNPVLPAGEPGEWDQNNYLGNVIELNNTLYIYYTGEANPNVSGTAIGVAASTDMGITWTKYSGNPIIQQGTSGQWDYGWIETGCAVFAQNELKLYYDGGGAATGNRGRIGLATSPIQSAIWQVQNSNLPSNAFVVCLSAVNDQVCWGLAQIYPPSTIPYAGFIRTTDGGNNWVCDTIAGISNGYFQLIFAIDADTAYATVYVNASEVSKGIYKTTNGGSTWNRQNAFNASQYGPGYVHFFDSQNGLVIGDPNLETYTTTNGGLIWNSVVMPVALTGENTSINRNGIIAYDNFVWFSTGARLFKSTDRGYTWTIMVYEPQYINWTPSIAFQDSMNGIYSLKKRLALDHFYRKTTDGGVTWVTLSNTILNNLAPTALQHLPGTEATYIVGGGMPQGMRGTAVTYDAGESWSVIDTAANYQISFPSYTVGWSSQYTTNVVRKYVGPPLSVEEERIDEIPTGYSLSQNYPNPFNPSTRIKYQVSSISRVSLVVYDILGNEIETLINEEKPAGTYELTWYAENLPSGIYFYQLKTGDFVSTKKMILLK